MVIGHLIHEQYYIKISEKSTCMKWNQGLFGNAFYILPNYFENHHAKFVIYRKI